MINQKQAINIYGQFLKGVLENEEWYKKVASSVKAVLLYGSVAKGTNRDNSDIDILIIIPLDVEEEYTIGEYIYIFKDYEINIVLRSIEKLRIIARDQSDQFQKEVFRNSRIISSADDEVKNLLERIGNIK